MKKLLTLLGVISLSVVGASAVVACGPTIETVKDYGINNDTLKVFSKIINNQAKEDIKNQVDMNWTYSELFNIKITDAGTKLWDEILFTKLTSELREIKNDNDTPKYTVEEIADQKLKVIDYMSDGLELVYINGNTKDEQKILKSITKQETEIEGKEKTLEEILFNEVNKQLVKEGKEPIENSDSIASVYPYASLGFSFSNKGNIKLDLTGKNFWTFTFK